MEKECCTEYATGQKVSLPSYAHQFYLDLLAGHLIPMQSATDIGSVNLDVAKNVTTEYLQDHPVELHMMPKCDNTSCTATGMYINDDGKTTDLTKRHTFKFSYSHTINTNASAPPDSMEIAVNATGPDSLINTNDKLGGL